MRKSPVQLSLAILLLLALATMLVPSHPFGSTGNLTPEHQHGIVSAATAVSSAVTTGKWSSPSTWSTRTAPAAGDSVTIKAGHTVTYDQVSDAVLGDVVVEGTLKFSREVNARLKTAGNVLVMDGGYLDMGNPSDILPKGVKSELVFALTLAQAKAFVGGPSFQPTDKGLWVMMGGRWDAHGSPVRRTWSKLTQDGVVGTTQVTVENDVSDWPVGGTVVVSSTRNPAPESATQNELHTIKSVARQGDGRTVITLNAALKYQHAGLVPPFRGEVALLTRNVVYRTEITGVAESAYVNDVRTRKFAHTMYMKGAKGDLQYAEFKYMGNYGKPGRYAIHHHLMAETSSGMVVRGTSGWYNGFRCVNLHVTRQVVVEENVCYSSSSTSYFVELSAAVGPNLDNMFVHNIAIGMLPKHFNDRNSDGVAGESRREAVDYWPGVTNHEAFLGNVSVGDGGLGDWQSLGYHFQEIGKSQLGKGGKLPWTMVRNEVHSKSSFGINSWQNDVPSRDIVDMLVWRNHTGGILWGAYEQRNKYYAARVLENGGYAMDVTSINSFLQDSVVAGNGAADNVGFLINSYILPQTPNLPVWLVRNTFKDLKLAGVSLNHDPCPSATDQKRPVIAGICSAVYMINMGNTYQNVPKPLDFGWTANANSFIKFFDNTVAGVRSPNAVVLRKDQRDSTKQGPISAKLVNALTQLSSASVFDALVTPAGPLPVIIQYVGLTPARPGVEDPFDYTFTTALDYPPTVSLDVTFSGTMAKLKATPADDKAVTWVEFFVDWIKVGTRTSAPYEVTVDLANLPDGTLLAKRRYAYLYARAFDGARQIEGYDQRAYSPVVEAGPEILGSALPAPIPPPESTPALGPTPTPGPTTTLGPTPMPTRTPTLTPLGGGGGGGGGGGSPTVPMPTPVPAPTLVPTVAAPVAAPLVATPPTPTPTPVLAVPAAVPVAPPPPAAPTPQLAALPVTAPPGGGIGPLVWVLAGLAGAALVGWVFLVARRRRRARA